MDRNFMKRFVFSLLVGILVCAKAFSLEQITEENYSTYGFTAENYTQYLDYYAITNKDDLYDFVTFVNQNHPSVNAVLTADIVVNEGVLDENGDVVPDVSSFVSWTPINTFSGTFDGQHHAIKGLYYKSTNSESRCALILTSKNATIKNVGLVDSYFEANEACAFVLNSGYVDNYTVSECYNESTFVGTTVSGIALYNNGTTSVIRDCYNTGKLVGGSFGIARGGWQGSMLTIENCFNTYFYLRDDYYYPSIASDYALWEDGAITTKNCYNSFPNTDCNAIYRDNIESGALCMKLNVKENIWYQTLGVDTHPVLDPSHGIVYTSFPCMRQTSNTPITTLVYHVYVDGYCTICGEADIPILVTNGNCHLLGLTEDYIGFYAIANSSQLYWFAEEAITRTQYGASSWFNAVLIDDIVVNEQVLDANGDLIGDGNNLRAWTPIGGTQNSTYQGTFDGNGHYISGLYVNRSSGPVGLFGGLTGVVKNLGIKDSYFKGDGTQEMYGVGSICGTMGYSGTARIRNCYSEATVKSSSGSSYVSSDFIGGISGGGYGSLEISNCYFGGKSSYAGIVGGRYSNYTIVSNCYNIGSSSVAIGGTTQTNCYALSGCASTIDATIVTMEQVASGELCYWLNKSVPGGSPWKQTLGVDGHPVLDASHESIYMSGPCLPHELSNTALVIEHTFHDGICTVCGAYEEPSLVTDENYASYHLDANYVGYYAIGNTGQLYSFAAGTYPQGVLYNDIYVNRNVLSETGGLKANVSLLRVWDLYEFDRLLDGDGHTINGLFYNDYTTNGVGLFSSVTGNISNVGIADSYFSGNKNVGALSGTGGTITNCWSNASVTGVENVGGISGSSATITNSYNTGFVTGSSAYTGGVCGYEGTLTNCYNAGRVSGKTYVGGLNGANATITDSYNFGQVSGTATYVGAIAGTAQATNCYYLENSATDGSATVQTGLGFPELGSYSSESSLVAQPRTAAQFASGDVCFRLNGMGQGVAKWYQTIGTDTYPVLSASHGVVYASSPCPAEFGNEEQGTHNHEFGVNGVCSVCGEYTAEMLLQQVTAANYSSLGLTEEHIGYYCITTVDELYWFAHYVNAGHTTINAVLLNNLTVNELEFGSENTLTSDISSLRIWTAIGTETVPYQGSFDGQNHTIGGLYYNNPSTNYVGLFGKVTGSITNVGIVNSYINANNYVGAVAGFAQTITNSYNSGVVKGQSYVGGVAGESGTITNCYNLGFISGNENVGGVVGTSETVTSCYNNGAVSGKKYVGGVVGANESGEVNVCYNKCI